MESHEDGTNGGFNPFSFSLTFGNPIRAIREKLEESQEISRDAVIVVRTYVSPLRGKRRVIHNWG